VYAVVKDRYEWLNQWEKKQPVPDSACACEWLGTIITTANKYIDLV